MAEDQNKKLEQTSARLRQETKEIRENFDKVNRLIGKFADGSKIAADNFNKVKSSFTSIDNLSAHLVDNLNSADKIQEAIRKNNQTQTDLSKQLLVIDEKREAALKSINGLRREIIQEEGKGSKKSDERLANLKEQLIDEEDLANLYAKQGENVSNLLDKSKSAGATFEGLADSAQVLSEAGGGFEAIAKVFEGVPILKNLSKPFNDAAKASRDQLASNIKNNTQVSTFGAGMKGFVKSIQRALKGFKRMAFLITGAMMLVDFIIDLFVRGDKLTTNIAKNLGVSKQQAQGLLLAIRDANIQTGEMNFNLEQMLESQQQLVQAQGVITASSITQAKTMATLTDRLGISAENAGTLLTFVQASGEEFETVFNRVQKTAAAQNKLNQNGVNAQMIFKEVAETSADILANFGFSFDEIGKAVGATRRLGVSLTQARNIANGLLDFESSITSELEAEILLGKQFNFERARALAATGDIAGATQEVLKQTQNLNDEQLRSPIIQEAIAKSTGLSADEFMRARKIQQMLTKDQGKLTQLLNETTDVKQRAMIEEGILAGANFKEIQKNISAQQKFTNAIQNVKDQFQNFATAGGLETLANYIEAFVGALRDGKSFFSINPFKEDAFDVAGAAVSGGKKKNVGSGNYQSYDYGINADDFTIKTNPKDTLVMAGGTKLGDETNTLLKELISTVNKKAIIDIDEQAFISNAITYSTK